MAFINVKHKSSSASFFKSAIRISSHKPKDLLKLEKILNFIENCESW